MAKKGEWECIDLKCSHYDGDMCMFSGEGCEPLVYEDEPDPPIIDKTIKETDNG